MFYLFSQKGKKILEILPPLYYNGAVRRRNMERVMCVLDETKECDNCMECEMCDLDPSKVCDNCGKCLDIKDFASIRIDRVITDPSEYEEKK